MGQCILRHLEVAELTRFAQKNLKVVPLESPQSGEYGDVLFIQIGLLNVSIELSLLWEKMGQIPVYLTCQVSFAVGVLNDGDL